jgi:hypothetical protein
MFALIDNNQVVVMRGTEKALLRYVERQRQFDPSYALWLVKPNGLTERVL